MSFTVCIKVRFFGGFETWSDFFRTLTLLTVILAHLYFIKLASLILWLSMRYWVD